MRVLFITSAYPTHRDDARGIFIHRLARGLVRGGIRVTVVVPSAPTAASYEEIDGVQIYRVRYWFKRTQRLTADLSGIIPNLKQNPWLLVQVPPLIAAMVLRVVRLAASYDVIHAHWLYPAGIAGVIASRMRKIPLVLTSHGGDLNSARNSRVLGFLAKEISLISDRCIGVSRDLCEQFVTYGVPHEEIACIPYGVDIDQPAMITHKQLSAELRNFQNLPQPRLLYLGSLTYRKSVETLIEALGLLQRRGCQVSCAIVGSGPTREGLRKVVRERSYKQILFVDPVSPSNVPGWMAMADMLILPSISEGRPVVILEAMAMGVPVIATDIPGTRELVRNGQTGFLFPPGDSVLLAQSIEDLANCESVRNQMGWRAKEYVKQDGLTTAQIAQNHIDLYQKILNAKKHVDRTRQNK